MTVAQIKERIAKAEEKLAKKQNTIVKKTASIEKKSAYLMKKYGVDAKTFDRYDHDARLQYGKTAEGDNDIYWTLCDISNLEDDIKNLNRSLPEIEALIVKYNGMKAEAEKKGNILEELPEVMKLAREELIKQWDIFDIQNRERMKAEYAQMEAEDTRETPWDKSAFKRFLKKYSYQAYRDMSLTNEEIHKENVRSADAYVIDLYNRVVARVGEITAVEELLLAGPALNGYITGTLGTVEVRTILAGGYNIQRLHCRTLVYQM